MVFRLLLLLRRAASVLCSGYVGKEQDVRTHMSGWRASLWRENMPEMEDKAQSYVL